MSRTHCCGATESYLADLPVAQRLHLGSSLKFGLLAAGEADLYPRFRADHGMGYRSRPCRASRRGRLRSPILQARASFTARAAPARHAPLPIPEFIAKRPAGALMHREGTCHASRPSIVAALCQDRGIDEIEKGADPRRVPQIRMSQYPQARRERLLAGGSSRTRSGLRSAMKQGKGPIPARAPIASARPSTVIDLVGDPLRGDMLGDENASPSTRQDYPPAKPSAAKTDRQDRPPAGPGLPREWA